MTKKIITIILFMLMCSVCQAACVAHWKMNDNAATTDVVDSAGSYTGTAQQNTEDIDTTGKVNGALAFNGTDDYVDIGDAFQSTFQDSFTVNIWVKPDDGQPSTAEYFWGVEDLGNGMYVGVKLNTTGTFYCQYTVQDATAGFTTTSTLSNGQEDWIMVTMVVKKISATTTQMILYKDGALDTTGDVSTVTMGNYATDYTLYIGSFNNNGSSGNELTGSIDDTMIFDEALTGGEIKRLYNSGSGAESPGEIEVNRKDLRSRWRSED